MNLRTMKNTRFVAVMVAIEQPAVTYAKITIQPNHLWLALSTGVLSLVTYAKITIQPNHREGRKCNQAAHQAHPQGC
jgi:hypothetical protein